MGYYIHNQEQRETSFNILSKNVKSVIKVISELDNGAISNELNETLRKFGWEAENNEKGDVINIVFIGKKRGRDGELFTAIAPFVEDGSYIEMEGEHNDMWRWAFEGGRMKEKSPTIVWE